MSGNQMVLFEGQLSITILMPEDVNFDFVGDFIIAAKDVAVGLEYQGASATNEVLKFCKTEHVYLVKNSDMVNRHIRKMNNAGEKFISNLSLNRVLGQSGQPRAIPFQDFLYEEMLPSIQKTGRYERPGIAEPDLTHFKKEAHMLGVSAEILRLPESGRLKMLGDFNKQHGFNIPLPAYADEPDTKSATVLLKEYGLQIGAKTFNELLIQQGLLEVKERPSRGSGVKYFKSLTEEGIEFGKNLISPNNPRETAPHYFPAKFEILLKRVGLNK
ncbi:MULTISPECIES: BRO-N domain-containing protein [unclassified Paenibacillus]|uniref:BRO-N domain-containing protein n=1 Tax=unclassified Paenibacillus TaxID=185978 RepID=UPI0009A5FF81|nr:MULTISPECIES: Bro-N domain-containing protein [unclassified Paenibacillus]SLJ92771.1 BRO family, N-terminal domain [Paenibacillus sp. RU5A]SOC58503.1 BRO family, N-terminal domain [Paenibacillus sp. RU26A]SOC67555.1 BRO family, N-terminal domain [Paenibacillus sp. RU5M]